MRPATTRPHGPSTLYVAFELGNTEWKLAMTTRIDQPPLERTTPARALATLEQEVTRAKAHLMGGCRRERLDALTHVKPNS